MMGMVVGVGVGGGDGNDPGEDGNDENRFESIFRPTPDLRIINENLGDCSNQKIKICSSNHGCRVCPALNHSDEVSSTVTHRKYKIINHEAPTYVTCNSSNLIYLLTCDNFKMQYVGQTVQTIQDRMSKHRGDIRKGKGSCPFLIKHFNSGPCRVSIFSIQVVEKFVGNGRTARN